MDSCFLQRRPLSMDRLATRLPRSISLSCLAAAATKTLCPIFRPFSGGVVHMSRRSTRRRDEAEDSPTVDGYNKLLLWRWRAMGTRATEPSECRDSPARSPPISPRTHLDRKQRPPTCTTPPPAPSTPIRRPRLPSEHPASVAAGGLVLPLSVIVYLRAGGAIGSAAKTIRISYYLTHARISHTLMDPQLSASWTTYAFPPLLCANSPSYRTHSVVESLDLDIHF
ncbi:hypothetical protein C8Q76DRAFT_398015 [Earliella scabrosa]|nr:hypothetical protein C8Q76DRAFT_398015 [Earliella scabrosa]